MNQKKKAGKILRWLPGLLISLLIIYFLVKFINVNEFLQAVKSLSALDITIMLVLVLLSFLARANGWRNLLDDVSFKDAFLIVNEGYFFNNLIPRSGEIVRTILVSGLTGISAFQAASSILVERALDIIVAATMFLLTLPFAVEMEWVKPIAMVLFICFLVMIIVLIVLARKTEDVKNWLANRNIKSTFLREKILPKAGDILDGLATLNNPAKFARAIFWILMSWVCWTVLMYFGITRLTDNAPFWWAIFTQSILALGIALPSAPAGLGVYEGTLVAGLSVFGLDESQTLSIALVMHFTQIFMTAAIGIYGLIVQGQSMSDLLARIGSRQSETSEKRMENHE